MTAHATSSDRSTGFLGFAAAMILAATLLAAASLTTGMPFVNPWTQTNVWPQPLDWIARILSVKSWPTHDPLPLRLVAWALGTAVLLLLAGATRRRPPAPAARDTVLAILAGTSAILGLLVALRAAFSTVPLVGLMWAWQLGLALLWMLVLYVWTVRSGVQIVARAVAISLGLLAAVSLLFCIEGRLRFPNIPTGNVLFLTSACLAGLFLTGAWAYASLVTGWREGKRGDLAVGLLVTGLSVTMAAALWMASRRAALMGLAAGAIYIVVLLRRQPGTLTNPTTAQALAGKRARHTKVGESASRSASSSGPPGRGTSKRGRRVVLATVLAAVAAAGILATSLYKARRWESVWYRVELYRATAAILLEKPATALLGIGPGQLCFQLTTRMRPLHAESPRLFHGQVEAHAHSEPLQVTAELGIPLGLLYLALPLGGLIGFACAYRKSAGHSQQLTVLGAGAALAATLAAEATSVGMRHPGVAILVWTLVGIGWACGASAGGFGRLTRWLQPAAGAIAHPRSPLIWYAAGIAASLFVLVLAWQGLVASGHLYQAQQAANRNEYEKAARLLAGPARVPTADEWMVWKYVQGRASLALMRQAATPAAVAAWQTKARDALTELVDACPAYEHAPIYLSDTYPNWDTKKQICERFLRYDPYDSEARLTQASYPGATPSDQMQAARLAIRNTCIDPNTARMMAQVAQDPAVRQELAVWLADAARALHQPDPAAWPDPLALESLRIAVVLAGQQGRFAEAFERAGQAATLLGYLAGDPWRNRPEVVLTEVYLDHAWFSWLLHPQAMQQNLQALHVHLLHLPEQSQGSFSRAMAAQFVAMLWLERDRPAEADQALRMGDPAIRPETSRRMAGLAYARLIALAGSRVSPQQARTWSDRGSALLGREGWRQALEMAGSRGPAPWWLGVLSNE